MKADRAVGKEAGWSKLFHIVVDRGVWAQLSWKAKAVYIVLHRHINDARICWPGIGGDEKDRGTQDPDPGGQQAAAHRQGQGNPGQRIFQILGRQHLGMDD